MKKVLCFEKARSTPLHVKISLFSVIVDGDFFFSLRFDSSCKH